MMKMSGRGYVGRYRSSQPDERGRSADLVLLRDEATAGRVGKQHNRRRVSGAVPVLQPALLHLHRLQGRFKEGSDL